MTLGHVTGEPLRVKHVKIGQPPYGEEDVVLVVKDTKRSSSGSTRCFWLLGAVLTMGIVAGTIAVVAVGTNSGNSNDSKNSENTKDFEEEEKVGAINGVKAADPADCKQTESAHLDWRHDSLGDTTTSTFPTSAMATYYPLFQFSEDADAPRAMVQTRIGRISTITV